MNSSQEYQRSSLNWAIFAKQNLKFAPLQNKSQCFGNAPTQNARNPNNRLNQTFSTKSRVKTQTISIKNNHTQSSEGRQLEMKQSACKRELNLNILFNIDMVLALSIIHKVLTHFIAFPLYAGSFKRVGHFNLKRCFVLEDNRIIIKRKVRLRQLPSFLQSIIEKDEDSDQSQNIIGECQLVKSVIVEMNKICNGLRDFYDFYVRTKNRCNGGLKYSTSLVLSYCKCSKIVLKQDIYFQIVMLLANNAIKNKNIENKSQMSFNTSLISQNHQENQSFLMSRGQPSSIRNSHHKSMYRSQRLSYPEINYQKCNTSIKDTKISKIQKISKISKIQKIDSCFSQYDESKSFRNSLTQQDKEVNSLNCKIFHQFDLNLNQNSSMTKTSTHSSNSNLNFSFHIKNSMASTSWKTCDHQDNEKEPIDLCLDFKSQNSQCEVDLENGNVITFRKKEQREALNKDCMVQDQSCYESSPQSEQNRKQSNKKSSKKLEFCNKKGLLKGYVREVNSSDDDYVPDRIEIKGNLNLTKLLNFHPGISDISESIIEEELEKRKTGMSSRKNIRSFGQLGNMVRNLAESIMTHGKGSAGSISEQHASCDM